MFKEKNYVVIKNAISKDKADFLFRYFKLKREVAKTMFARKWLSPYSTEWGQWNCPQIPNTYVMYGDVAFDCLLEELRSVVSKYTELDLVEQYSFARLYKKGDELKRHKDRYSCEISTTLNLGGDLWPIFIEPDSTKGIKDPNGYKSEFTKGVQIDLEPGDMVVYNGVDLEHWREPFDGEICGQVFFHYNTSDHAQEHDNRYDGRPHLGLPDNFVNKRLYKFPDGKVKELDNEELKKIRHDDNKRQMEANKK
jgi:hypothetical protein